MTALDTPLTLLGGLSASQFMQRYWQRRALLIRQAIPGMVPPVDIAGLKKLAAQDDVQSRLIWRDQSQWHLKHGPLRRVPAMREPDWTLLVQSLDQHDDAISELLSRFRFIPDARVDDVMVSLASQGGGVGPHFDSYDVFLLQAQGTRRWRISQQKDLSLLPDMSLKILRDMRVEDEFVLEPGDMLYLPPNYAHDGIAESANCMTISIGFRSPTLATLAQGLLEAAADQVMARLGESGGIYGDPPLPGPVLSAHYRDPGQPATAHPAELPDRLVAAAQAAVRKLTLDQEALAARFLGCWLSEPSDSAVFDAPEDMALSLTSAVPATGSVHLDRRTRMLYRKRQLFINGEVAPIAANALLRHLADHRSIACHRLSTKGCDIETLELLDDWLAAGWMHWRADK